MQTPLHQVPPTGSPKPFLEQLRGFLAALSAPGGPGWGRKSFFLLEGMTSAAAGPDPRSSQGTKAWGVEIFLLLGFFELLLDFHLLLAPAPVPRPLPLPSTFCCCWGSSSPAPRCTPGSCWDLTAHFCAHRCAHLCACRLIVSWTGLGGKGPSKPIWSNRCSQQGPLQPKQVAPSPSRADLGWLWR